jgi:hypothetical protein
MVYSIEPKHEFLVGIDSDGCVFDTMELKHKECFIPNIINFYELQGVSKYAREAAEFVNLYSKSRGINRFPALIEALEWLQKRPEVKARGTKIEIPQALVKWIAEETKLGNPALEAKVKETGNKELKHALDWSLAVNEAVKGMVRGVPPFPHVRESLEALSGKADMLYLIDTLSMAGHHVVCFDLRAHGQSGGQLTSFGMMKTLELRRSPSGAGSGVLTKCTCGPSAIIAESRTSSASAGPRCEPPMPICTTCSKRPASRIFSTSARMRLRESATNCIASASPMSS